jgi:UDP-N-acetylglucosamine 2-epimerase
MILVTGHRRESFGLGFEQICQALAEIAHTHPEVQIVYPVHLNPNVSEPVNRILGHIDNVMLIEPQDYLPFVWLMDRAWLILTDSGGIQEEAPRWETGAGHARYDRTSGSGGRRHRVWWAPTASASSRKSRDCCRMMPHTRR